VILLVAWLARRMTDNAMLGVAAMFVMATSIYFIKYAARAMTDVPFTFFFIAAVCTWVLSEDDPRWLLAAGAFTAVAQLSRTGMGIAIPALFAIDMIAFRKRRPIGYLIAGALVAFVPVAIWYAQWIYRYRAQFFGSNAVWLSQEVYGDLSPAWRRYTGAFEYIWMVAKSYWPWLPATIAGAVFVIRRRSTGADPRLRLLMPWVAVVYVLCAITKSRVLRYMLPAYPAFAILAAVGLFGLLSERTIRMGLRVLTPILAAFVL
jgi:4-amino-4-deoxy-L-arabinose transferase-like glycosyltransferase